MTDKLRAGVIGCGEISGLTTWGFRTDQRTSIHAVADPNTERTGQRAAEWGVEKTYETAKHISTMIFPQSGKTDSYGADNISSIAFSKTNSLPLAQRRDCESCNSGGLCTSLPRKASRYRQIQSSESRCSSIPSAPS
ncbi:MAG: hypothetical protein HY801_04765 [Candidatus Lindowbacteria bacterium]|nr:hypothetical protein [Candidatus Lindowbacteria bacterium]